MTRRPHRQAGFTLLELIVAAGILALIAVFSWRGLDTLIREREAIAASQAIIDGIQRAFARVERDAMLANDAQLDDGGTLRLVAGASSVEGAPAATVEYRLVSGALVRTVVGADRAPLVVLGDVTALSLEAWLPARGGGAWVKSKPPASEPPPPSTNPPGKTAAAAGASAANTGAAVPTRSAGVTNMTGGVRTPQGAAAPIVAAATGVRLSFDRADGTRVVRTFMVGGS
ncbi:MAG: prepilin-type N-terminal cleavage/methylation domain-containing protein [Burkholderiaceae bacterium]